MWEKLVGRTKVETASFYTCWTFLGLAGRKKANAQYERECTSTRWSFAAPCAYRAREIRGNKPKQRQATEKKKEPLPLGVGMDRSFFQIAISPRMPNSGEHVLHVSESPNFRSRRKVAVLGVWQTSSTHVHHLIRNRVIAKPLFHFIILVSSPALYLT